MANKQIRFFSDADFLAAELSRGNTILFLKTRHDSCCQHQLNFTITYLSGSWKKKTSTRGQKSLTVALMAGPLYTNQSN